MNKKALTAEMAMFGDTQETLAKAIGVTRTVFNKKLNERNAVFTQSEILAIKKRYNLTPEKVDQIFFGEIVS